MILINSSQTTPVNIDDRANDNQVQCLQETIELKIMKRIRINGTMKNLLPIRDQDKITNVTRCM